MARVITDMRLNMSSKFEGPFWAAVGIDFDTNVGDQRAVLHLIREIYNPILYDCLQKGGHWNTAFKGKKSFEIRRRLTNRRNEFPAVVLAHVPQPPELTERLFDILRYYRFTDPSWRAVDPNYPVVTVVPLPAPAGGLAPRPPPAPAPVIPLAFTTAPDIHPAITISSVHPRSGPTTTTRTRARTPVPTATPIHAPITARAAAPAPVTATAPGLPPAVPISRVPFRPGTPTAARVRARARANAPARPPPRTLAPAPAPSPAPSPGPSPPTSPIPTPSHLIQPVIGLLPDLPPVIAPDALHAPIPDSPQPGYYVPTSAEVPSPPRSTDLDAFTRTMERANRKRARHDGDEEDGKTTPPQKKRSIDAELPKEKSEWTNFTTLSDSSSADSRSLDADGDIPMDENYKVYKMKNKSDEPEPSVWSTMRDYLVGRKPTPQDSDEEL
ncbi:hypothetical protein PITC_048380 [Penicillium italicum]|uniref:Uncharacterized protein n=1 Tax=Penicillium italicum TaxID=40296 RepID=A0A0A2LA56_PENIT|nr:hypothetical protein PITC_048380 [Penicillium italicum]